MPNSVNLTEHPNKMHIPIPREARFHEKNEQTQFSLQQATNRCRKGISNKKHKTEMDVTKAELVGRMNWRRQEKIETVVGEWKDRVYEVHNVVFSFRSRKVAAAESDVAGSEQVLPLELDEDDDDFLVAENPNFGIPMSTNNGDKRRHSSFVREEREWVPVGRKSVDLPSISVVNEKNQPNKP